MKKLFYTLFAICLLAVPAKATHLMGGEMTVTHISGFDYEINLTTYRDTLGIPMSSFAWFDLYDISGTSVMTIDTDVDSTSGYLLPLFPYGVEVYKFKDTITMPGVGRYTVGWSNCCRNGAILNAAYPLGESMFLYCEIEVYDPAGAVNSSPEFLNEPVVFMPVGLPWSYNPLPFDADGDSLAWSVTDPLDDLGTVIDGWTLPAGDSLDPFSIDPVTGTITWTPSLEGNFVASIQVDEYRGGVHIGSIVRDMQMIVVASDDSLARFGDLSMLGTNSEGYYWEELMVNNDYTLTLYGSDPDLTDELSMNATGEPFLFETDAAEFETVAGTTGNSIAGIFTWTPHNSHSRDEDYIVVFRLDDGIFATDLAILFKVSGGISGIGTPVSGFGATLFPNPTEGMVTVRVNLDRAEQVAVHIYNAEGKRLYSISERLFNAGTNDLVISRDLPPGQYWVALDGSTHRQAIPFAVTR